MMSMERQKRILNPKGICFANVSKLGSSCRLISAQGTNNIFEFILNLLNYYKLLQIIDFKKMQEESQNKPEERRSSIPKEGEANLEEEVRTNGKDVIKIKEENDVLFQAAYGERKNMNIARMRDYMKNRGNSFRQRSSLCTILRAKFQEKQKYIKLFLKNLIGFFEEYVGLYISLQKSLAKFQLKRKYKAQVGYAGIREAIEELLTLNDSQTQHVEQFINWIDKILIQALKSSENYFKDRVKKLNKIIQKNDSEYAEVWSKEEKTFQKISDGNDLLEKQLILMERIKNSNQFAITRVVGIHQCWEQLLEEERSLKKMMSENILQFHDRLTKFHKRTDKKTDGAQAILNYWSNLSEVPNAITVFSSFLTEKDMEFIAFGNKKSNKLSETFESFMRMQYEEERIGNPFPFLDILIAKKFKGKMQMSQREWIEMKLIFTVDHNLLIVNEREGKVALKLMQRSLKVLRSSENILELNGLEEGIIFNSKKKQMVHFETLDQVEQFAYFISTISQQKNQ